MTTATEQAYGEKVFAALTRSYGQAAKYCVIDTSRNGLGPPAPAPLNRCNPTGRAVGAKPTAKTTAAHADAYLSTKLPGESVGSCRSGEPAAGVWWTTMPSVWSSGRNTEAPTGVSPLGPVGRRGLFVGR